jgi:hypothetical protein
MSRAARADLSCDLTITSIQTLIFSDDAQQQANVKENGRKKNQEVLSGNFPPFISE